MNRFLVRVAFAAAALSLTACGNERGNGAAATSDSAAAAQPADAPAAPQTEPAGAQPAPTAQTQAAPQTEPNTPQAYNAQAPAGSQAENRPTKPVVGAAQTYASCMARARASGEGERQVIEATCRTLPDAPKR